MKILAFDSSNEPLSVALTEDEEIITEQTINIKRNHSIQLMPAIEEALRQADWDFSEIDRVAVASGPGSYTGLRIAVTTAKTLAWSRGLDLIGISSLKVLAANSFPKKNQRIVPLFDARRQNIYTGLYGRDDDGEIFQSAPETHISAEKWAEYLVNQEGTFELIGWDAASFLETFKEKLGDRVHLATPQQHIPRASALALLALKEAPTETHTFIPNYLKLAEAEENWLEENPDHEGEDWVEKI